MERRGQRVTLGVTLLDFDAPVSLFGGGEIDWCAARLYRTTINLALDGGANAMLAQGLVPDYAMGDFDSITPDTRARLSPEKMIALDDQNFTDFRKALEIIDAPTLYVHGVLGGRLDHSLDALAQLGVFQSRRIILFGGAARVMVWPSGMQMNAAPGRRIAIWSAGESMITRSEGLKWPIDGRVITPAKMSVSNQSTGAVRLLYSGDPLIVMLDPEIPL